MRNCIFIICFLIAPYVYGNTINSSSFSTVEINQQNLVANLYIPKHRDNFPVVIIIGGSSGGMNTAHGKYLAENGIAALTLAYFRHKGLPTTLDNIPVEYVHNAIDYLERLEGINVSNIGIWGASRGSELAFIAASTDSRIKSVVATSPSKVAWHGATSPSAWTYQEKKVPSLTFNRRENTPIIKRATNALNNINAVNSAHFSFEQINGPILLISAEKDGIWPSFQMAKDIIGYLTKHKFKHTIKHKSFKTGHTFNAESWPHIYHLIVEHFKQTLR